jgi:hypothetical protein
LIAPGWWRYGVMMTHIGSVGLGSHIVSVFMLTWVGDLSFWFSWMLKMVSFMVFWGKKAFKLSIST